MARERKERRERDRALRKTARKLEKAATVLPGGAPANAITASSAAVVEGRARAVPCALCGGELELRGDRASSTPRGVLRELQAVCRRCHAPRTLWFLVAPTLAS